MSRITLILTAVALLAFAACGHKNAPAAPEENAEIQTSNAELDSEPGSWDFADDNLDPQPLPEDQLQAPNPQFDISSQDIQPRHDLQDSRSDKFSKSYARTDSPQPKSTQSAQSQAAPAQSNAKTSTFYISTYGAQGEVWGHVTMKGNTGRGTIHDHDENTLSITATRHGNELYATDQNGRQYVFKL